MRREDGYLVILDEEAKRLEEETAVRIETFERTIGSEDDADKQTSKRKAHEGWLKSQQECVASIRGLRDVSAANDPYKKIQGLLEALRLTYGKDAIALAGNETRQLILALMALESPNHVEAIRIAQAAHHDGISHDVREAWAKLMGDELLLHFADPDHAHTETRAVAFTPELMNLIESAWRITQIRKPLVEEIDHFARKGVPSAKPPKHPFMDGVFEARMIEHEIERVKNPKKQSKDVRNKKAFRRRSIRFMASGGYFREILRTHVSTSSADNLQKMNTRV